MASKTLSDEHKKLMAQGRRQTSIVERYLSHIEQTASKKKQISPEQVSAELLAIESELDSEDVTGVLRLELLQKREDLQRLALEAKPQDDGELEKQFIAVARTFGDRKGVSYSTWREFGVPKRVLDEAGVARTRRAVG